MHINMSVAYMHYTYVHTYIHMSVHIKNCNYSLTHKQVFALILDLSQVSAYAIDRLYYTEVCCEMSKK